jgi:pimeloyl-ACP methyl ester carboxylesterase
MRSRSFVRIAPALALALGGALTAARADAKPTPRWQELPEPPALPAADASGDVAVDDAQIHYAVFGKGEPVVLLHGGLGNGGHWGNQVAALAPTHRVVVIDSRGQGRSSRGTHGIHYHQMAEDVIAVLDALHIDRAAIVGWSDGAIIGLDLAIHHGDRLTRLFAFAGNYDLTGMKKSSGRARTVGAYFARCKAEYKQLAPDPKQLAATTADLGAMWTHEPTFRKDDLREIHVPTVIADGDHDEIIRREHTEEMAKLIPGAKLVILRDASHFALWQAPDDFDRAVLELLDGP